MDTTAVVYGENQRKSKNLENPFNNPDTTQTSAKMPSRLDKVKKQIAKKRNGQVSALHEKSRNSLRLHKAAVRDQKLDRQSVARALKEQPICKFTLSVSIVI